MHYGSSSDVPRLHTLTDELVDDLAIGGHGSSAPLRIDTMSAALATLANADALVEQTRSGPTYVPEVARARARALRALDQQDLDSAARWLLIAQWRAGMLSFDEVSNEIVAWSQMHTPSHMPSHASSTPLAHSRVSASR